MRVTTEPGLLGGFVASVGDVVFDASLRRRVEQAREAFSSLSHGWPGRHVGAAEGPTSGTEPGQLGSLKGPMKAMAELNINAADIAEVLRRNLENFTPGVTGEEVGRIREIGDGIARITGLPNVAVNELLELEGGVNALALNLDEDSIGAVILGDMSGLQEGQLARATGRILSVPVGDALLGRVVDTLGRPLDGLGPIGTHETRRLEVQAPGIIARQPVKEPLQTGIKAIDSMTPIGRGQRELIIGDRKTGKTSIAIDTIINQAGRA